MENIRKICRTSIKSRNAYFLSMFGLLGIFTCYLFLGNDIKVYLLTKCPELQAKCEFTYNRSLQNSADMLLIHMRDPYVIFDRPAHQKWVFFVQESPPNVHVNLDVSHAPVDGDTERWRFNLTMTYHINSTFHWPYGFCRRIEPPGAATSPPAPTPRFILPPLATTTTTPRPVTPARPVPVNYAKGKTLITAWFVGNCRTLSRREKYVKELKKYTPVNMFGCGGQYRCPRQKDSYCLNTILHNDYKFYLAFENSFCVDYATEKLFKVIGQLNVVPIVSGYYDYENRLPPHSFIDARNYKTPKELGDYINLLNRNDTLYNEYFAWRHNTAWVCGDAARPDSTLSCQICAHGLANRQRVETVDIKKFWSREDNCRAHTEFLKGI